MVDGNTKVTFTLSIGTRSRQEETFTIEQLGIMPEDCGTEEELERLLQEEWENWTTNYIDGGWTLEE